MSQCPPRSLRFGKVVVTILLDTGIFVWMIDRQAVGKQPSLELGMRVAEAERLLVSTVSLFEIAQKARIGKWPEAAKLLPRLPDLADRLRIERVPLSEPVSLIAGSMAWNHADPFDRMIVATAVQFDCPVATTDRRWVDIGVEVLR